MKKIKESIYEYFVKNANDHEKIKEMAVFVEDYFTKLKEENPEVYNDFKEELDEFVFEIDDEVVENAISHLHRKDGKEGRKWNKEDTTAVGNQYGIFTKHISITPLIWYFALNYTYAVHYKAERTISEYIELTCDEIHDKNMCIEKKIKFLYKD